MNPRLQNSPYFCVFKFARAVKQKVWNDAENRERDWGETLTSHALRACKARALRARKTLTPRFTDFFTDFEKKKTDCFAVYMNPGAGVQFFPYEYPQYPCLMIEEIPAHLLRPRVLTRCQNASSSAKIAQCRHQPHFFAPCIFVSREQEGSGQME